MKPLNETGPRFVTGSLYSTSLSRRRDGKSTRHADADNAPRPPRPLSQAPLRPSEGLLVAFLATLNPCPDDRSLAQYPGKADGESTNMGPPYGKHRRKDVGNDGKRRSR